jgi:hypothetical protein
MFRYYLKHVLNIAGAMLVATLAASFFYALLFNRVAQTAMQESSNPPLAFGLSAIAVVAPIFAIMETLIAWLKDWRARQRNEELIQVIAAQSTSPLGMDILALTRESGLPRKILQSRVNELILLGRVGVKYSINSKREYFLIS